MRIFTCILVALMALAISCGGAPEKVDRDGLQRNADDAQRDLDRNSGK